ncbi:MAG: 4-hydroxythreonine-4-phosphate dehydrogenase PdxA [Alphaproteobacteria bacterium]|nr:MAG: 4-hydroxythreonine-4-phosphate dehydrogenase PdxA [Alphaproteobacteria bacterium]
MPSSTINNSPPLVISAGEPAGIGPEIILKSWAERHRQNLPAFFVVGNPQIFLETARKLGLNVPVHIIRSPDESRDVFINHLPIYDLGPRIKHELFHFGSPITATANMTIGAIKKSVDFIFEGKAAGLITAPIQKSNLYDAGFTCPGHTEYLAELCGKYMSRPATPVMMLVSDYLRVVPLTIHMALRDVSKSITADLITQIASKINKALMQDFCLENPRIVVAGLNPHAGENGAMGEEDEKIIRPAIDHLRAQGINIQGPLPADTLFHAAARTTYDTALCMYHDQALIPIKTLDFDGGVNVTLGLPIVRTSPDHGTALNIAGKNLANPKSMINAIKLADKIYQNRQNGTKENV